MDEFGQKTPVSNLGPSWPYCLLFLQGFLPNLRQQRRSSINAFPLIEL